MAESLGGWKAGKLRKAADLVSEVGGSSVFGASAVFCAGSVCCVLILAAHDVCSCAVVENAALADSAENGAAAAGSGSLAAGTPAARDGTSVAAASAEIGTGIGKVRSRSTSLGLAN